MRLWEQEGIDLEGAREAAAAVAEDEGGYEGRGEERKTPGLGQRQKK